MRNLYLAAIGLSAILAIGASSANAEEASQGACAQAQSKISHALSSDADSAGHDAATKESHYGRDFCNNGLYKQGMEHYARAMKLLGIS